MSGPARAMGSDTESLQYLSQLKTAAAGHLQSLSKVVLEGREPPPGPYAIFYEIGNTLEKLETCYLLVRRLFEGAEHFLELAEREATLLPRGWPAGVPFPKDVSEVMEQSRNTSVLMRVDFESLYVFGGVLLDQWALVAGRVGSLHARQERPFVDVVCALERGRSGPLQAIWDELRSDLIWLDYHIRHYRNRLIVHGNRPWQRGTSQILGRIDFRLVTLTPVGWINEAEVYRESLALVHHVAASFPYIAPEEWRQMSLKTLLASLFEGIGRVEHRNQRERIAELYSSIGGTTPSFQAVGERLFSFVGQATDILVSIAKSRLNQMDLGNPHKTNAQMEWE